VRWTVQLHRAVTHGERSVGALVPLATARGRVTVPNSRVRFFAGWCGVGRDGLSFIPARDCQTYFASVIRRAVYSQS
jgi:hypothetical protein